LGFSIAKIIFKRHFSESIIIGMTSSFSNHLFFVYPIALFEFGPKDIVPIETIISVDFITVGLSVCALELAVHKKINFGQIFLSQLKNPALIGLFLGLMIFFFQIHLPLSVNRLVNFICDAGTPCALIAMGVLLSYQTDKTQIKLSIVITLLKILIFPLILFIILHLIDYDLNISRTTMMVAAAPIGAMGLVFASIYNVTTDAVVRSGIISYILALLSIPFVGNITP
jgi:predicted permease